MPSVAGRSVALLPADRDIQQDVGLSHIYGPDSSHHQELNFSVFVNACKLLDTSLVRGTSHHHAVANCQSNADLAPSADGTPHEGLEFRV